MKHKVLIIDIPEDFPAILDMVTLTVSCAEANLKIGRKKIAMKEMAKAITWSEGLRKILDAGRPARKLNASRTYIAHHHDNTGQYYTITGRKPAVLYKEEALNGD